MNQSTRDAFDGDRQAPGASRSLTAGVVANSAPHAYSVRVFTEARDLKEFIPDWEGLAADAMEASPSCEWWMLIPALERRLPGSDVHVALIFDNAAGGSGKQTLCGVFPFEVLRRYGALPATIIRYWNHIYSVSGTPLLRRGTEETSLLALFTWVRETQPAHVLLALGDVRLESAFFAALTSILEAQSLTHHFERVWSRAVFRPKHDAAHYIDSIGTNHHRHEWRRQGRRLAELGHVAFDALEATAPCDDWIEEFVTLEANGWKGREGSAFGSNDADRAWLAEVMTEAHRRGKLMMLALRVNGKAIAMRLNILGLPGSYAFKIAFDEAFLKYSPGVQLEMENIRRLHAMPAVEWMDSLAVPNHSLMNRVWTQRAAIASILIAPGRAPGKFLLLLIPVLRTLRRLATRRSRSAAPSNRDPSPD